MAQTSKTFTIAFEGENTSLLQSIDKVTREAKKMGAAVSSVTLSNPSGNLDGLWVAKLKLIAQTAQNTQAALKQLNAVGESILVMGKGGSSTDSEFKRRAEAMVKVLERRNIDLKAALDREEAIFQANLTKVARIQAQKESKVASLKYKSEVSAVQEKYQSGGLTRGQMILEIRDIKLREEAELRSIQVRMQAEIARQNALKASLRAQEEAHKRHGEALQRQWLADGEAHRRLGESLMRDYLADAAAAREAHRRKGEDLARAYAEQHAKDKEAHRRQGELLMQQYNRDNTLAKEMEATRLSSFSSFLRQREALLRADISVQRNIEISGMNSIEAHRAEANRKRLAAEQAYRNRIAIIESSVRGGTSTSVGQTQATAAMQAYLHALKAVDAQLAVHERAVQKTEVAHKAMWLRVLEVTAVYRIWSTALQQGQQALLSVPITGIHFEGTKAGLQAVSGSTAGAYREMQFLNHEANRTGLALDGLRSSFRLFAASAITSGESMSTVEGIFANVNTMATTLHLSVDDVNGIFLALGQTFNKGKLQSEELVKQLAQRVPGSVVLMAKAYKKLGEEAGKSGETVQEATQRLLKDMKAGSVSAHTNIEALGKEMALMFGGEAFAHASTGLNAQIGRLETSWTHLTENIYKASAKSMMSVLGFTTGGIEGLAAMSDDTLALEGSFSTLGNTIKNVGVMVTGSLGVFGLYKLAVSPVVGMFGVWRATWLGLNAAILASPVGIIATLIASLASLGAQFDSIAEKRAALEKLAFTPEEAPRSPTQEFSYKIDQDPRVKELNFAIEAANKNVEKYSATMFGKLLAPEELKRAQEVQSALFDKMILKRREVAAELKKQANLGNVNDESLIEETDYDRSSRYHSKLTKQIEDRISTLNKQKQLEVDTLNAKAKIQEDKTGKVPDGVSLENQTLAVQKKYREQINALIREKANLMDSGEQKTLEVAGKSITAFDKLVKIMRTMESKGRVDAVSPVGAVGKHQVMPSTLQRGNYGDRVQGIPEAELQQAIAYEQVGRRTRKMSPQMYAYLRQFATKYSDKIADFGVNELRKNFEHFGHDASKALAAYNTGRGRVEKLVASRGDNWVSGLLPETRNYVREGIRLGAPKAAGELDKYEGKRSEIKAQIEEQDILAKKEALTAESIAAQREKALRLEREKAEEQRIKNSLATEELQVDVSAFKQNQLASELAKITYDFDKKKADLEKNGNFAAIELLKVKTNQLRVQATFADAERKVTRDAELAAIAEKDLNTRKTAGIISEKQYQVELAKIKESQIPSLEEELLLVESITNEEDKRLTTLRLQTQVRDLQRESRQSLNQDSVGRDFLTQSRESSDPTNYKAYKEQGFALQTGKQEELANILPEGMGDKEGQLQTHETFLQQKNELDARYADANFINQSKYYSGVANLGAETFQGLTGHMIAMYGAQSKQARIAFIAYKAFMVSQTIMNTAAAVVAQLSNPTPYVGVALAAMAAATGAIQVAKIIAEPMPQAHGGLEYVPEDATYKLSKGERVLAPRQNEAFMRLNSDLSAKMQRDGQNTGKPREKSAPTVVKPQIRVVNIDYSSQELENHLKSTAGEEIVVNHMMRNREAIA